MLISLLLGWYSVLAQQQDFAWSQPLLLGSTSLGKANAVPVIVSDPANWLHVFWLDVVDEAGSSYLMYSRWDGRSWSLPVDISMSPEPGHVTNRPRAIVGQDGNLHVIWWSRLGDIYQISAPAHAADNAAAWSTPIPLPTTGSSTVPSWAVDDSGCFHLVYLDWETQSPHYLYSDDNGKTWSESVLVANFEPIEPGGVSPETYLAIDGKGRIHIVWRRSTNQSDYSRSEDSGRTWSAPMRLEPVQDNQADATFAPTVGTRGDDEIHLVWSGSYYLMPDGSLRATKKYHKWSSDGGNTWTPTTLAWENIVGNNGQNPMIEDSTGTLHTLVVTGYGPEAITWVLYSQWEGYGWSPLVAIPETGRKDWTNFGAMWHDMVLSQGNRLNIVWQTRDGDIWYANRQIDVPYIPPQVWPTSIEVAKTIAPLIFTPTGSLPVSSSIPPQIVAVSGSPVANPQLPVMTGVLMAFLILVLVVFLNRVHRLRR